MEDVFRVEESPLLNCFHVYLFVFLRPSFPQTNIKKTIINKSFSKAI